MASIPAGWYPTSNPAYAGKLQWWDGTQWTEFYENAYSSVPSVKKRRYYPQNLLRWRFWQFTVSTALLAGILVAFIAPNLFTFVFIITGGLMAWYWLGVQMACHYCGTLLRTTRLSGQQDVCHKCQKPTDIGA